MSSPKTNYIKKPESIKRSLTNDLADSYISNPTTTAAATAEVKTSTTGAADTMDVSNTAMSTTATVAVVAATAAADSEKDATTTVSEDGSTVVAQKMSDSINDNLNNIPGSLEMRDTYYILPKCVLPPRKRFAPVEQFVANAVQSKLLLTAAEGAINTNDSDHKAYQAVMDAIRRKRDLAMLEQIFLALRTAGNGSTLHQLSGNPTKHAQLLHFLLRFDPFGAKRVDKHGGKVIPAAGSAAAAKDKGDPTSQFALADAYFHLILALVSANSVFLVPTMTSLWKLLTIVPAGDEPPETRTQRLHATLAAITRLVPKGKTEIFPIMSANFPFRTNPEKSLIWCYRQCFSVVEYVPSIHSQVLQFIVDKCLEMDVEIKIHDGGEVTLDDEEEEDEDIFELEIDQSPTKVTKGELTVDEMADKLDALMLITFELLEKNGSHDVSEARKLYERCLPAFESSILITHRSKFTQFILFYLCGLESEALANTVGDDPTKQNQQHATLYREYAANLIEIIFDPYRATLVRQKAACYLASFVSRANFVEADTICESLCALLRWADAYIASLAENSISAADARNQCDLHALFYTVCQAAFYIMCFRGTEAVRFYQYIAQAKSSEQVDPLPEHFQDLELDHIDISPSRWNHVCSHGLQPLRYCLETVREEFLGIAKDFVLLDDSLLDRLKAEHNKKTSLTVRRTKKKAALIMPSATLESARRKGGVGGLGRGSNPLDSFFPFDPYLLRRSHPFIEPFYRNWGDQDDANVDMVQEDEEVQLDDVLLPSDEENGSSSDDGSSNSDDSDQERYVGSYDGSARMSSSPPPLLSAPRQPWTETPRRERAESIEIETGSW